MRLKDDLVQWQLKKSSDTDPVTFGLRCSGPEDAQRVREPVACVVNAMESCLCTCSVYTYIVIVVHEQCTYSETYLVRTSKGTQNQYLLSEVLTIRVGLCA